MKRVRGMFQKSLKNRSSKDLYFAGLVGPGTKPITWSMSGEALEHMSKEVGVKGNIYETEINRRAKNRAKRKTPRPASVKKA